MQHGRKGQPRGGCPTSALRPRTSTDGQSTFGRTAGARCAARGGTDRAAHLPVRGPDGAEMRAARADARRLGVPEEAARRVGADIRPAGDLSDEGELPAY